MSEHVDFGEGSSLGAHHVATEPAPFHQTGGIQDTVEYNNSGSDGMDIDGTYAAFLHMSTLLILKET